MRPLSADDIVFEMTYFYNDKHSCYIWLCSMGTLSLSYCTVGWSVQIFFDRTEHVNSLSSNQRLGTRMILEVQFKNFGARVKVLIFKKFQGAQILR